MHGMITVEIVRYCPLADSGVCLVLTFAAVIWSFEEVSEAPSDQTPVLSLLRQTGKG